MATLLRPDPTFYPSPRLAGEAPAETLAYLVTFDPTAQTPDALLTVDVDPSSATYRQVVGRLDMPNLGDELHHFGWNACSSALCPYAPHPDGVYVSALGSPEGDGPGGIFVLDHNTFSVKGRFELDRGPQFLAYDFWWHLGYDVAITSEWGTPKMV